MKRILEVILAYQVCRKYGIRFYLFNPCKDKIKGDGCYFKIETPLSHTDCIYVALFQKYFIQTFFHELGHVIGISINKRFKKYDKTYKHLQYKEEVRAWKYCKRVMKKEFDEKFAIRCLNSYSTWWAYHGLRSNEWDFCDSGEIKVVSTNEDVGLYTDTVYNGLKRLMN